MKIFAAISLSILLAAPVHSASLVLKWTDNSDNEDGFKIERRLGTTGAFAEVARRGAQPGTGTIASDTDTGLIDQQNYCYRVRAFNAAGDSGYTNIACGVAIEPTLVPNDPTVLIIQRPVTIIIP